MSTSPAPMPVSSRRVTGPRILVAGGEAEDRHTAATTLRDVIPGTAVRRVVGTAACLADAGHDRVDVVLLEAGLSFTDRFELAGRLVDKAVIAVVHDVEEAIELFGIGVRGIIAVGDDVSVLADAVTKAVDGRCYVTAHLLNDLSFGIIRRRQSAPTDQEWLAVLSNREREILDLLVAGWDQAGIAAQLRISPSTAKTHIRHLLIKLGVRSVGEATALAARSGLLAGGNQS